MSFSLEAIFGVDTTGVSAGMKSARRDLNNLVNDYGKLGAGVAVGAFVAIAKGAIDLGGHLVDTSQNIGINVEALQALEAQHKRNGVSSEQLTKALEKTKAAVISAAEGDAKASAALADLHLKSSALIKLPLDQQYEAIAKAAAGAKDQQQAYAAVSALIGEKVGPKLMGSLRELAQEGLPGVVKSAREAGQVLDAETIVALDRAGDAIDDFKKKTTVAIGNIIVNFRSEEGLELLGMKLLKIAGSFGGTILDAFGEGFQFFKAASGAAGVYMRERLQNAFVDAAQTLGAALNKVLPDRFEINIGNLEKLRAASEDFGDIIAREIAAAPPVTFKKDIAAYWDKAISDQQKVVDNLNRVDLGTEADKLRHAGDVVKTSIGQGSEKFSKSVDVALDNFFGDLDKASTTMKHAGAEAGASIVQAAQQVAAETRALAGVIAGIRGGGDFNEASDSALAATVSRNRAQAADLRNPATASARGVTYTGGLFGAPNLEAARLEAEALNAQAEINLRAGIRRAYATGGSTAVYQQYSDRDPLVLDKLIDQFAKNLPQAERTTNAVERLVNGLAKSGFIQ